MFRKGHLAKTIILFLCWNATVIVAYALALNTTKLHGDNLLNFLYSKS